MIHGEVIVSDREEQQANYKQQVLVEHAANRLAEGTSSPMLCGRCAHGVVFSRRAPRGVETEPTVFCQLMQRDVPTDIVACSKLATQTEMPLHEMNAIALKIDTRVGVSDGSYR